MLSSETDGHGKLSSEGAKLVIPWLVLFFGTLIVYFVTRTRYNTFDAVSYANQVEHLYPRTHDAHWLFHPHHLLFNATAYVFWSVFYDMGYRGGALRVIQDLNILWGALGISLYYLILRMFLQRSRWLPMLISIGLSVCFGYWISATDARVNMPSTTLLIGAFYVLCRFLESPHARLATLTGFLAGLAVLYHESAGIFFAVGLVGFLIPEFDGSVDTASARRQRLRYAVCYASAWIATVVVPYLMVAVVGLHLHTWHEFRHWMTSYSELGWWWSFDVLKNILLDADALRRAAFVEPVGQHPAISIVVLYLAAMTGWLAAFYAFIVALPLLWRMRYAKILVVCVAWIIFYAVFFTFWSPGYFIFWTPILVPIGLLITLCLAHYRAKRGGIAVNWLAGVWIALVATVNLTLSIVPHLRESSDPFQKMAGDVAAHTKQGDLVVVAGAGYAAQCEVDIPYFADRDVVSLHGILTRQHNNPAATIAAAREQIDGAIAQGHNVYALDEVWHDPVALMSLEHHHPGWDATDITTLFAPYHLTHAWRGPHGVVWKIVPASKRSTGF